MTATATEPHRYVSEGPNRWRTCAVCGRGANAGIHKVTPKSCPACEGKGYVLGIDRRYPQDGNVAFTCQACKGTRYEVGQ